MTRTVPDLDQMQPLQTRLRRWGRWTVDVTVLAALTAGLLSIVPADPVYASPTAEIETDKPVDATDLDIDIAEWSDPSASQVWEPPAPVESVADAVEVTTDDPGAEVTVLDDQTAADLGVNGVVLEVAAGNADAGPISVDYSAIEAAYGAGWSDRLEVFLLPSCAAEASAKPDCGGAVPVDSANDTETDTLTVDFGDTSTQATQSTYSEPMLLAVTATADGGTGEGGDFSATKLESIGSWEAGSNTGAFTYSVPINVPPADGPVPTLGLSYSSAIHDGRTSGKNNQASWVGDGWSYEPGFVERTFTACSDDIGSGANNEEFDYTADQCWDGESNHITVSLGGSSATLLKDDATGKWYTDSGAAWKIEKLGPTATSSATTTERWKITTEDGTQYHFGAETSSRLTVPVFGNHTGEPCHATAFKDSSCKQAYRWMLDKTVDSLGNMSRYTYTTKNGYYAAAGDKDNRTSFVREAYLSTIEYGLRDGDSTITATGRIVFTTADRCQGTCYDSAGKPIETAWPEVPWDLHCDAKPCETQYAPVFFETKKLTKIATQVRTGTTWRTVDEWALTHEFKTYGSENQVVLWLKSIQQTGRATGTAITLPKIEFGGYALANRVEAADRIPLWRWRMSSIKTETGAIISIGYSDPECATLPSKSENTKRCYPTLSKPRGQSETVEDWFHKYVVTEVTQTDPVTESPSVMTFYDYSTAGGGTSVLWAWDDSPHTRKPERTYSQWRGYAQVTTRLGDPYDGPQEVTRTRYHRGMNGQPTSGGGTRSVSLTDAEGNTTTDHKALSGSVFETLTYNGSQVIEGSTTRYWTSKRGSQSHDGGAYEAWLTAPSREDTRRWLTGSTWQRSRISTTYDSPGRPTEVTAHGDLSVTGDETCTRTWYADSATAHLYSLPKREETVKVACATEPSRPADVLSGTRYYYDGHASINDEPTKGQLTRTTALDSWPEGGTASYATKEKTTYDAYGRVTAVEDPLGRTTRTAYTPSGAGPITQTILTSPAGHATTTTIDPAWGKATKVVDQNGRTTEATYDALGRTTALWKPGRNRASETASRTYSYRISNVEPSAVTTRELGAYSNYITTIQLYDALLRPRQVQTDTTGDARLLTLNRYDSHGRVEETRGPDFNASPPAMALSIVARGDSVSRVEFTFDEAGRVTVKSQFRRQEELRRITTAYGGSVEGYQVTTTPPNGAPASATIENARKEVVERRTYRSNTPTGAFDALTYAYTAIGALATVTDPEGNSWSWTYDFRGRRLKSSDPDAGTTSITYDAAGQVTSTTDARGEVLAYKYDALGRQTERRDGSGTLLASWTYDTVEGGLGLPASATRHIDGAEYTESVYSYDDAGRATSIDFVIPDNEGGLAGLYYTSVAYHDNGQVHYLGYSEMGSVSDQILEYAYDEVGNQTRILSDIGGDTVAVVDQATYSPFGEIQTRRLNSSYNNKFAYQGYQYEETTRRLNRFTFDHQTTAPAVADVRYTYDDSGNVLSIADLPADNTARWETQCFNYDAQRRLTEAWAQDGANACAAHGSEALIGGPAGYWNMYAYDNLGNRTSDILIIAGNDHGQRVFSYPDAGEDRPHAVTAIDHGIAGTDTFSYDASGNLVSQTVNGETLEFEWDAENTNTLISSSDRQSRIVYGASGNQLIRDDGDTVTLYLPETEVVWNKQPNTFDSTRYLEHAGSVVATVKGASMSLWRFVAEDHHGTAAYSVNGVTHSDVSIMYRDQFGMIRGQATNEWYGQEGFVGGTELDHELVHIGARTYNPGIGRFVSVDPVRYVGDLQQLNGYSYASNNPSTWSDPTGLCPSYMTKLKLGWMCSDKPGEIFKSPDNLAQEGLSCGKQSKYTAGACYNTAGKVVDTVRTIGEKVSKCVKGICGVLAAEAAFFLVPGGWVARALKYALKAGKAIYDLVRNRGSNNNDNNGPGPQPDPRGGGEPPNPGLNGGNQGSEIPWATEGDLTPHEERFIDETLNHIAEGTTPNGSKIDRWGIEYENWDGQLPGGSYEDSPYREYWVRPEVGVKGQGTLRVVFNEYSGDVYYTRDHYTSFIRIQ